MGSLPPQIVTHNIGVTFLPFRSSLLRLEHREMVTLITRRLCTFLTSTVSIMEINSDYSKALPIAHLTVVPLIKLDFILLVYVVIFPPIRI